MSNSYNEDIVFVLDISDSEGKSVEQQHVRRILCMNFLCYILWWIFKKKRLLQVRIPADNLRKVSFL